MGGFSARSTRFGAWNRGQTATAFLIADPTRSALSALRSTPAGVTAISRGLSAATPPVTRRAIRSRPRRGRSATVHASVLDRRSLARRAEPATATGAGTPPGCNPFSTQDRGYRFAQPPANCWHPYWGAKILSREHVDRLPCMGQYALPCRYTNWRIIAVHSSAVRRANRTCRASARLPAAA
jgi:hypothetical protein